MIIELFGLPGSGKTTIMRFLIQKSLGKDVVIKNHFERLFYCAIFLFRHPFVFSFWIYTVVKETPRGLVRYKLNLLLVTFSKREKAEFLYKTPIFLDEGLFQRILSVYEQVLTVEEIRKIIYYMVMPDKLFFIQGGDFDRFLKDFDKINSPRYKMGEEYMKNWVSVLKINTYLLQVELKKRFPDLVFEIDNRERSPLNDSLITEINKNISSLLCC